MQEVGDHLVDQTNERLRLARVLSCRKTVSLFFWFVVHQVVNSQVAP